MKKRDKMQTQQQASNHEKLASVIDQLIDREVTSTRYPKPGTTSNLSVERLLLLETAPALCHRGKKKERKSIIKQILTLIDLYKDEVPYTIANVPSSSDI